MGEAQFSAGNNAWPVDTVNVPLFLTEKFRPGAPSESAVRPSTHHRPGTVISSIHLLPHLFFLGCEIRGLNMLVSSMNMLMPACPVLHRGRYSLGFLLFVLMPKPCFLSQHTHRSNGKDGGEKSFLPEVFPRIGAQGGRGRTRPQNEAHSLGLLLFGWDFSPAG